jgi:hypothetical protein
MDQFYRQHFLSARTQAQKEARPGPNRPEVPWSAMKAMPGRPGRNTFQRQAESVAQPPKVRRSPCRQTKKKREPPEVEQRS